VVSTDGVAAAFDKSCPKAFAGKCWNYSRPKVGAVPSWPTAWNRFNTANFLIYLDSTSSSSTPIAYIRPLGGAQKLPTRLSL
jgi:hypothetical protein